MSEKREFYVEGVKNFSFDEFMMCSKTKYDTLEIFNINIKLPADLLSKVVYVWDYVEKLDFKTALSEPNMERRRVFFSVLGPEKIFKDAGAVLVDSQTVTKKRVRWDSKNIKEEYVFEDTYSLYKIKTSVLLGDTEEVRMHNQYIDKGKYEKFRTDPRLNWKTQNFVKNMISPGSMNEFIYAVKCSCPSTDRDYWIMVEPNENLRKNPDAIEAIASTIRIRECAPKRIYRQGDVIIVEKNEDNPSRHWRPEPLSKEDYLTLMYSET
jgi:hypothetical protein